MSEQDRGFLKVQSKTATEEIRDNHLEFGENVLTTKFPDFRDGLKHITRRIVTQAYENKVIVPLPSLIGDVVKFHTTESSVYKTIVRMGQDFMIGHPLVTIKGKSGKYYNPGSAAASRYLKAVVSDFTKDVFFTGVHPKTIPMRVGEKDFQTLEPEYYIPRIPMALVLGNLTVGFGFKSHIPLIDLPDVCDMVQVFAEHYKKGGTSFPKLSAVAKYCVPAFPIQNIVKNREEIVREYSKGNFDIPVQLEGWVELSSQTITLRAIPYGIDFNTTTQNIRTLMIDKRHWLNNHLVTINFYNSDVAEVVLELKRGQNPFEVLDMVKPLMKFNFNWRPIPSYLKDGRVIKLNPVQLTQMWYTERMISIAGGLKYQQNSLILRRMLLSALLIIADHTDKVIDIIRNSENEEEAAMTIRDEFPELTLRQSKLVAAQKLSSLTKNSKKQVTSDIEQTDIDLENIHIGFKRVHDQIYNDASYLKKKYGSTKISKSASDYIGYVRMGNLGIVHFSDDEEMHSILNTRWNVPKFVYYYSNATPNRYLVKQGRLVRMTDITKEIACEQVVCRENSKSDYSLVVGKEGMTIIRGDFDNAISEETTVYPITEEFFKFNKDGSVSKDNVSNYTIRKTVGKGIHSKILGAISANKAKDIVVFHINSSNPKVIRVDRLFVDDNYGKLCTTPMGDNIIMVICPTNSKKILLNIPVSCRKGSSVEHILIPDVSALFESNERNITIPIVGKSANLVKTDSKNFVIHSIRSK